MAGGASFSSGATADQALTDDSSDSGFDWSGVINSMVGAASQITQKVLQPPPFIQAPNGAIYSPTTGQVAYNPAGGITGSILLLVVAGVAVFVFMRK